MDEGVLNALSSMPHGIYVLTSAWQEKINAMIASWVTQVSYDPPLVMVAVHPNRLSHHLLEKGGSFGLHLISKRQEDLLKRFKGPEPERKFSSLEWSRGKTGCPLLKECIGFVECVIREKYQPGNHTLFVGEVINARVLSSEKPLTTLEYGGTYTGKA
ncbi:MAG: flavin reductase [Deltaproteobacteria bacterium]|nr:flavin reductase [Deltaproteobacteria bacterium]MBW1919982.1 flavin reductase [Deltaproteobacteria bacterium]MBW1936243.1 flavin reductase [Deltaproteobacteria bacterium]MBW1977448.1 flavin reductase [Deltaproteobacteria bacterium]MBW2043480.1 flavin reductase [Deltaproteobacteria bacterium]